MKPCNAPFYRYVISVGIVSNLHCRLIQVIYTTYKSCCTECVTPFRQILAVVIHENVERIWAANRSSGINCWN